MQQTLESAFWYIVDQTPIITSVKPSGGPISGGTVVTLTGLRLLPDEAFSDAFGGWPSTGPGFDTVLVLQPDGTAENVTQVQFPWQTHD